MRPQTFEALLLFIIVRDYINIKYKDYIEKIKNAISANKTLFLIFINTFDLCAFPQIDCFLT